MKTIIDSARGTIGRKVGRKTRSAAAPATRRAPVAGSRAAVAGGAQSRRSPGAVEARRTVVVPGRQTRGRHAILEILTSRRHHWTADQVHAQVRRRLPRISLATVYRNLELLTRAGMIRTLAAADGQRRYDGCSTPHAHFWCRQCGQVHDLDWTPAGRFIARLQGETEHRIETCTLDTAGVCAECRSDRGRSTSGARRPRRVGARPGVASGA